MSESEILFSIIVLVYNVENYLKMCIDSMLICRRDIRYEIILIDDGSTDGSGVICDQYAGKFDFIQVLHQRNQGLSVARNRGIELSTGKYLLFVDSDDCLVNKSLDRVADVLKRASEDIIFFRSYKWYSDHSMQMVDDDAHMREKQIGNRKELLAALCSLNRYPAAAWGKAFRRDLIVENQIFFEPGRISKDIFWSLQCFLNAHSISFRGIDFYLYRQNRSASITGRTTPKRVEDLLHAIVCGVKLAKREEYSVARLEIYHLMAYEVEVALLLYGQLERKEQQPFAKKLTKLCGLLKFRDTKRTKVIRGLLRIFGLNGTAAVLKWGYGLRGRMRSFHA